jgi:AcrR family transcriptional regulator
MLSVDNPTTRERSLRAALEVVRADGLPHLTTRAIARHSGLTQPAIYRHFEGVEELVLETLGSIRALFLERLASAVERGGTAEERLREALDAFLEFALTEPRLYDALFLRTGAGGTIPHRKGSGRGPNIFAVVVERVAAWRREAGDSSPAPVAATLSLMAQAQGLVLLYRQGRFGSERRFREAYRQSIAALLRGLPELPG